MIHTSRNTTRGKKNDEDREEDEGREKKKKDEREKDRDVEKDRDRENEEQKGEEEDEDDCNFGDAKPDPHFEVYDMRIFLTKYLFFLYFLSRTLYYLHIHQIYWCNVPSKETNPDLEDFSRNTRFTSQYFFFILNKFGAWKEWIEISHVSQKKGQ